MPEEENKKPSGDVVDDRI